MMKVMHLAIIVLLSLVVAACGNNGTGNVVNTPNGFGAIEGNPIVFYFYGEGCPYCTLQKAFLDEMEDKYPDINIVSLETWSNRDNQALLMQMASAYGFTPRGVPVTFIGDRYWAGFNSALGSQMESKIVSCIESGCENPYHRIQ
ncbi:MAG: glutaredoxin family protein [Candidatus Woesearchaeota archaeon]